MPAKPDSKGAMDIAVESFARGVADRFSRRSLLATLGSAAAAALGIKFMAPFVVNSSMSFAAEASSSLVPMLMPKAFECDHGDDCTETGKKCAFGSSRDCLAYKKHDKDKDGKENGPCKGCWDQTAGCPGGTVLAKDGSGNFIKWSACCICKGQEKGKKGTRQGDKFHYFDCCGDLADPCKTEACKNAVKNSGCKDKVHALQCDQGSDVSWCGSNQGNPACTLFTMGGTCSI